MPIKLTRADQKSLNLAVARILKALTRAEFTAVQARAALTQMVKAAALGNDAELRSWLTEDRFMEFKKLCRDYTA